MQVHLFTTSKRNIKADLSRLEERLLPKVTFNETLFQPEVNDDEKKHCRQIAVINELSDVQKLELLSALADLGIDDINVMETQFDEEAVISITKQVDIPVSFFGTNKKMLNESINALKSVEDLLENIIKAKPSGIDYPEKSWTGELLTAYQEFVKRLGNEPMKDKGSYLSQADVLQAAKDRPVNIPETDWEQVEAHLSRELKLFNLADKWFGISGYLHGLFAEQRIFNDDFLTQMNDKYLHIDEKKSVVIVLDDAMQLSIKGIGLIEGYGTYIGAAVSVLWNVTKESLPDDKTKIKAQIADMQTKVADVFKESVVVLSNAHDALVNDWGLLDIFGKSLEDHSLEWPTDLSSIRTAQSRGFQYTALQSTVHLLSGVKGISQLSIGVIDQVVKVKKKQDGKWINNHGYLHYQTHSEKHGRWIFKNWYCREVYLGYSVVTMGSSVLTKQDVFKGLQQKLFGRNIDDSTDPQLGLPAGFLLSKNHESRNGWNLKNIHF